MESAGIQFRDSARDQKILCMCVVRHQAMNVMDLVMQRFPVDPSRTQPSIKGRWRVVGCAMTTVTPVVAEAADTMAADATPEGPSDTDGCRVEALLQPSDGLWMACHALEAVLGTCHKAHASRVGKRGFMPFCASVDRK